MGSQISALYLLLGYKVNIFYNKNKNLNGLVNNIKLLKKKYYFDKKEDNYDFFDDLSKIKHWNNCLGTQNFNSGDKSYPKERLEVFSGGTIHIIDNFKKLRVWGSNKFKNISLIRQDKGQLNCVKEFLNAVKEGDKSPIEFNQILEVQTWLLKVMNEMS